MRRVLLVDDHAIVRAGLRRMLQAEWDCDIREAATGAELLAALAGPAPDLVVLDLNLPGLGGIELLRRALDLQPGLRVLVLSMHAEPLYAARALETGARGYLSKNAAPEEILAAVQRLAAGGRYVEAEIAQELALQGAGGAMPLDRLSERDLEILRLLAAGSSLQQVASALGIAYKTAANACTQVKVKLGVARTADLIRVALECGLR